MNFCMGGVRLTHPNGGPLGEAGGGEAMGGWLASPTPNRVLGGN